jgi:hypothetical protein
MKKTRITKPLPTVSKKVCTDEGNCNNRFNGKQWKCKLCSFYKEQ